MLDQRVAVRFTGGAFASLGYSLLCLVLAIFVIPTAWGVVALMAWWCGRLTFSDGSRAEFVGRAGRIWPLFAAVMFLAILPNLVTTGMPPDQGRTVAVQGLMVLVLIPLDTAVKLAVYRWLFENIELQPGGAPRFHGKYLPYLGWVVLFFVSFLSIIGWAWVATAIARWFCRNIEADGWAVVFEGTGWGLLWRSFVWLIGLMVVIPIPWVLRSMYGWWTDNLVILRFGPTRAEVQA